MKKLCTVVCLLLTVAMLPVVALAQSQKNQSENLSQFQTLLKQEQERSSFLDEWNDESIDLFTSIVKDSGIVIEYINPDKYVTLYKDSEDRIVYEVGFDLSSTKSNRVLVDAFSGQVYTE